MSDTGPRFADASMRADDEPAGRSDGTARRSDGSTGAAEGGRSKVDVVLETGLSPEQFVLEEIESRGAPVKQQEVCEFTGWSDSCISRLLTDMEDAGTIARVRIGREKLVFLSKSEARAVTARYDGAETP